MPDTITLVRGSEGLTTVAAGAQAAPTTAPLTDVARLVSLPLAIEFC